MRLTIPSDLTAMMRGGLFRSVASLGIKVATAGLTYLTFVVLSRTMSAFQYGEFAIGLSLATVLAVVAGLGQPTAIMRIWPADTVAGRTGDAVLAARAGASLTVLAGVAIGVALIVGSLLYRLVLPGTDISYLWATALLVAPLALAEYQSSALRAQGSLWTALVPRDLVWRIALPLAALLLAVNGLQLGGSAALLLAAILLVLTLLGQGLLAQRQGRVLAPALGGVAQFWRTRGTMSRWFLFGAVIDTVALNADTLIVGFLLDQDAAATYFNASRTAGLMTLFTYAATLVIAPQLAQHFHAGDRRRAQAVTAVSAWSGFGFSLAVFALFAIAGNQILAIFGEGYAQGLGVLLLLSTGLLFDAATGSSRTTMMMTNHERAYVYIAGAATLAGLVIQILVIPSTGLLGAAAVNMGVRIATQLLIGWYCVSRIGIDPTIFGLFKIDQWERGARA